MSRLHRFFGDFDFNSSKLVIKNPEITHQIKKVLRLKAGDEIILADGHSKEAVSRIITTDGKGISVEIRTVFENSAEPVARAVLYAAVLKNEHFEFIAEKATEAGIKEIVPILTNRTVKQNLKIDRLRKIISEAAEQSGRGIIPSITDPVSLEEALALAQANEINLFFEVNSQYFKSESVKGAKSVGLFIGPEGGWHEDEIERARQGKNMHIAGLGRLTLRAETAAAVASFLVVHALES